MKQRIKNLRGESGRRKSRRRHGTGAMTDKSRVAQGSAPLNMKKTRKVAMPKMMLGLTGCKNRKRVKKLSRYQYAGTSFTGHEFRRVYGPLMRVQP